MLGPSLKLDYWWAVGSRLRLDCRLALGNSLALALTNSLALGANMALALGGGGGHRRACRRAGPRHLGTRNIVSRIE